MSTPKVIDGREPWLWLESEDDEQVGTLPCGCALHRDFRNSGDPAFVLCPKHEAIYQKDAK